MLLTNSFLFTSNHSNSMLLQINSQKSFLLILKSRASLSNFISLVSRFNMIKHSMYCSVNLLTVWLDLIWWQEETISSFVS